MRGGFTPSPIMAIEFSYNFPLTLIVRPYAETTDVFPPPFPICLPVLPPSLSPSLLPVPQYQPHIYHEPMFNDTGGQCQPRHCCTHPTSVRPVHPLSQAAWLDCDDREVRKGREKGMVILYPVLASFTPARISLYFLFLARRKCQGASLELRRCPSHLPPLLPIHANPPSLPFSLPPSHPQARQDYSRAVFRLRQS